MELVAQGSLLSILIPMKEEPWCHACPPTSTSGIAFCATEMEVLRLNSALYSSLESGLCAVCWGHQFVLALKLYLLLSWVAGVK